VEIGELIVGWNGRVKWQSDLYCVHFVLLLESSLRDKFRIFFSSLPPNNQAFPASSMSMRDCYIQQQIGHTAYSNSAACAGGVVW